MKARRKRTRRAGTGLAVAVILVVASLAGAASATHDDGFYDQPIISHHDSARVDILVVPPTHGDVLHRPWLQYLPHTNPAELHPYENTYMQAVLDSIEDWERGIEAFGPGWLKNNVDLRVHVLGQDLPAPEPEADIEMVVTAAEEINPLWSGVAIGSGDPCVASTTKLSGDGNSRSYREMYGLAAHEIGHCLGLHHVGDGTNPETFHPDSDVMSYGPLTSTKCASNLNVEGLELVFGPALGHESDGDVATIKVEAYDQIEC